MYEKIESILGEDVYIDSTCASIIALNSDLYFGVVPHICFENCYVMLIQHDGMMLYSIFNPHDGEKTYYHFDDSNVTLFGKAFQDIKVTYEGFRNDLINNKDNLKCIKNCTEEKELGYCFRTSKEHNRKSSIQKLYEIIEPHRWHRLIIYLESDRKKERYGVELMPYIQEFYEEIKRTGLKKHQL